VLLYLRDVNSNSFSQKDYFYFTDFLSFWDLKNTVSISRRWWHFKRNFS